MIETPKIFEDLSKRAKRVLSELGVCDIDSLLRITREDLSKAWSCGKNTIKEIEFLQLKLNPRRDSGLQLPLRLIDERSHPSIRNLSFRAKSILKKIGVAKDSDLFRIRIKDLSEIEGCGIKTISEIEKLKSELLSGNVEKNLPVSAIISTVNFSNSKEEVFQAVKGALSIRSKKILEKLNVSKIEHFIHLSRKQLLDCRNCGIKTVNEIMKIKDGILYFADALSKKNPNFELSELLSAPCLSGIDISMSLSNSTDMEKLLVDLNNPSRWLKKWIRDLSSSKKIAKAFMLRKGMSGAAPMTLEETGRFVGGLTRERVRQMEISVELKASIPQQQHRIAPLIEMAAEIVGRKGGLLSLDELTKKLFCKGEEGEQLEYATELVVFFSKFEAWKKMGLVLQKDGTVRNKDFFRFMKTLSCKIEEMAAKGADERYSADLWSMERKRLKEELSERQCFENNGSASVQLSDEIIDSALKKHKDRVRGQKDRIYSISLWKIRFGKNTDLVETILKISKEPLHFSEVAKEAKKYGRTLSERNVHSALDRCENALLWERGTFLHKDNIVIPFSLLHDVENWLSEKLEQDVPFVSANLAFNRFENRCKKVGLSSEVALYSCLRQSAHPNLAYPKLPFVYLKKGFTERLPVVVAFEIFLRDAGGRVTREEAADFALSKLGLKDFQYNQVKYLVSNVLRTIDCGFLHIDNAEFEEESLWILIDYVKEVLAEEGHCSIEKIYNDKRITCMSSGIDDPAILYSLLQIYEDDFISLDGYPLISVAQTNESASRKTVKKHVVEFIRNHGKPCSFKILDDTFVEKFGYNPHTVYAAVQDTELCMYQSGCFIHLSSLDWNDSKQKALERSARALYEDSIRAGNFFARISYMVESSGLPELPDGYDWSDTMIADLLVKGKRFLVLGNAKEAFLPRENEFGIRNFESLIGKLLERDWGGAANHKAFEDYVSKAGIVQRRLTPAMLGSARIVAIENGEIYLKELIEDAQKPRLEPSV